MGLTIHYGGKLRQKEQIFILTEEVADICQSLEWKYHIWDELVEIDVALLPDEPIDKNAEGVYLQGISFTPPECETVFLTCLPSGCLSSIVNLMAVEAYPDSRWVYTVHFKTQFAGSEMHVALVSLLKYLEQKYLTDMEVFDEGQYWETLDKALLQKRFDEYTALIASVASALENSTIKPSADVENLANQIEEILRKRLDKGDFKTN